MSLDRPDTIEAPSRDRSARPAATPRGAQAGPGEAHQRRWITRWWPWLAGLGGSLLALGPGLRSGSLLNLDLVLTPHLPLPPGLWGLGPALPQRIPAGVPQALLAPLVGAPTAGKAMIALALVVSFAGAARLCAGAGPVARVAAGVLYGLGPFAMVRVADGHLNVLVVLAVIPFALPVLLHPGDRLARTYLWALALSLAGSPGGATAAIIVAVGLVADRGRRALAVTGVLLLSCLVWLAPSASVLAAGAGVNGAGRFATVVDGPVGFGRLQVGMGFWRGDDLGADGAWVLVLAVVLVALAAHGHRDLPAPFRNRLLAVALVGLGLALASAVPVVRDGYRWFTDLPLGAPFRESQRSLCLWLAWLAPAAALGATRVSRALLHQGTIASRPPLLGASSLAPWLLGVGVVFLSAPAWWGADGRLQPVQFPAGWDQVARRVDARPGTVLALPWKEYLDISFAGGRRVLNPLPDYLGGDVLASFDPEFDLVHPSQEQVDRRADQVDDLLPSLLAGRARSGRFAELGVRWVVLAHETTVLPDGSPPGAVARATWSRYRPALAADPGLSLEYTDGAIELWRVKGWRGPVRIPGGGSAPISGPLPILQTSPAPAGTWDRSGTPGWLRGLAAAPVTPDGLVSLPDGHEVIWFWPGFLVLAADGMVVGAVVVAGYRLHHQPGGHPPA